LLYFAVTENPEAFDAEIHSRQDLDVLGLAIPQAESEYAIAELELRNPRAAIPGKWLHISEDGKHLFHGELSVSPRGLVGGIYRLEAIGRPADAEAQKVAAAEALKGPPHWDPLFSNKDDLSEVLAGHGKVPAWSRTDNSLSVVDPIGSAPALTLTPLKGTLDVEADEAIPASASLELEVEWKQLNVQQHSLGGRIGRFETMTHSELAANWPSEGAALGGGATVVQSSLTEHEDEREELSSEYELGVLQFDPGWAAAGTDPRKAEKRAFSCELDIEQRFEVRRKERCTVTLSAGVQEIAHAGETEVETIKLGDISARSSARAWAPDTEYSEGDQVVDGGRLLETRQDHYSGDRLNPSDWRILGEPSYISSRRIGSFFKTDRGQAAIAHAVERLRARLRYAARSVLVSFDCAMPDPDLLTHDCTATVESPDLIGGSATGRVVSYSLHWSSGRRFASVTLACAAGNGLASEVAIEDPEGDVPVAWSRVDVEVHNEYADQSGPYSDGQDVPETFIEIRPQGAPASDFEQEITVPISGFVSIPKQVILT